MNRRQAKKDFRNRAQAEFDKAVFRSGYYAAVMDALEIIESHLPHGESWMEDRWSMGYHDATKSIQLEVQALVEKQQAVQMFEDMLEEQALKGGEG